MKHLTSGFVTFRPGWSERLTISASLAWEQVHPLRVLRPKSASLAPSRGVIPGQIRWRPAHRLGLGKDACIPPLSQPVLEMAEVGCHPAGRALALRVGFKAAYNARRQRVLDGKRPNQVVTERLEARSRYANTKPTGQAGPCDTTKARLIAEAVKEVSQPDS